MPIFSLIQVKTTSYFHISTLSFAKTVMQPVSLHSTFGIYIQGKLLEIMGIGRGWLVVSLVSGYWLLVASCRLLVAGYWLLVLVAGC